MSFNISQQSKVTHEIVPMKIKVKVLQNYILDANSYFLVS